MSEALTIETNDETEVVENAASVVDAFRLPVRNWTLLIDSYNSTHKRKFPYTPLQCKVLVEYCKKSIPAKSIFKTIGTSPQKYTNLLNNYKTMEERMVELASKTVHLPEEYTEFQGLLRNPYRLLMSDIERAEGCSELKDWERFNEMAYAGSDVMSLKMKSKFRDFFEDKDGGITPGQITINLGGSFIEDL